MSPDKPVPPCSGGCPVNTDVSGYLDAITRGEYMEAYRIISDHNPFPSVCAWVCPHPCEDGCRRGGVDEPLSIRALKRFAVERATGLAATDGGKEGLYCPGVNKFNSSEGLPGGDVAVIGAGPAGLAAAGLLAGSGFSVTVLERQAGPGGHFFASLPLYRLPRRVVNQDVRKIMDRGVKIFCGVEVGRDVTVNQLRRQYRAVIIAAGLQESRGLPLPGFGHPAVLTALPYLQGANLGGPVGIGRRVVVIGGGDVAMDVARTAVRQGAGTVEVACLESGSEIPAHPWEVEEALEEGVVLNEGWGPEEAVSDGGRLAGLRLKKVLSVFDSNGRFNPTYDDSVTKFIEADNVIVAVGQRADLGFLKDSGIMPDGRGYFKVDPETMATPAEGIFACGEIASGPGAAISAVASGQRAARSVERYLRGIGPASVQARLDVIEPLPEVVARRVVARNRQPVPVMAPGERKDTFRPFEIGFSEAQARQESARCMRCGMGAVVVPGKCAACLTCARLCPFGVPVVNNRAEISMQKCQGCGICAAACPAGAIEMLGPVCGAGPSGRSGGEVGVREEQPVSEPDAAQIVLYACRYIMGKDLLPDFAGSDPDLSGVRVCVLPGADSLSQRRVVEDVDRGAWGVALVACGGAECLAGGYHCRGEEFSMARSLASQIGLDQRRLLFCRASETQPVLDVLSAFVREVKQLGPAMP